MIPGGFTEPQPATPEIQEIANTIKPQLEARTNEKYGEFKAEEYKSQVVAGTNYLIKIRVSGNRYIHVKVFRSLPGQGSSLSLVAYQTGKSRSDELNPF
ncbi:cystatin-A [Dasypus novemcinctus]|uniref:cystatin-A n=1 Tax=Dasypus novemcinctus TaxID=9361 RepID=UPI00019562BA|nr:cystatin-A [Dasypus novemcinctus]